MPQRSATATTASVTAASVCALVTISAHYQGVTGTNAIKQMDIVKNQKFVYTSRPGTKQSTFEFTDKEFDSAPAYYYLRVLQEDGQLAWSSPVWVNAN